MISQVYYVRLKKAFTCQCLDEIYGEKKIIKEISTSIQIMLFRSAVSEERSKMSKPIRGRGGHLVFRSARKNTNLVEDVKILLPVKFR